MTGHASWIDQVLFLLDGRLTSCSNKKVVKIWDLKSTERRTISKRTFAVDSMALLPNGWLAGGSGDKTIQVWDVKSNKLVRALEGHTDQILSMKTLSNGNLASYSIDDTIRIWNPYLAKNNLLLTITGHGNKDWIIPFSVLSNGCLVACSRDNEDQEESTMRVWRSTDGQLVRTIPTGHRAVWQVLALSNGQIAIGTEAGAIKIIDLDDDKKSRVKEDAYGQGVSCLLQLSNGDLVSAGIDKGSSREIHSIKVWGLIDLSLLQLIRTSHSEKITSLSVSSNEALMASGSRDKTIKLWPLTHNERKLN